MKNNWGRGGGLNREGGLINFLPLKRGGLLEGGGLFERGGLTEDLRYSYFHVLNPSMKDPMDLISMDNNMICSDMFHPRLCGSGLCRSLWFFSSYS